MGKKINVSELLKDCPKGMELDCTTWENVTFEKVVNNLIVIRRNNKEPYIDPEVTLNQYGCRTNYSDEKCIIFPKGKTTWEGFQRPIKDGDIVYNRFKKRICIYHYREDGTHCISYCRYNEHHKTFEILDGGDICIVKQDYRLATEEERQKLFKAIKDNGYKWNAETKTLERLNEPKFKSPFNDGDIVVSCCTTSPFIYSGEDDKCWHSYCGIYVGTDELGLSDIRWLSKSHKLRLANDVEKERLFQVIKANGYKWNSETKTIERLIEPKFKVGDTIQNKATHYKIKITDVKREHEYYVGESVDGVGKGVGYFTFSEQDKWVLLYNKFDVNTLKPFDRVLVRGGSLDIWRIQLFEKFDNDCSCQFRCVGYDRYKQCIPYEGNEHLLGKTDDCDDFFKTWEE